MKRRDFIRSLFTGSAGLVAGTELIDWERFLWQPGRRAFLDLHTEKPELWLPAGLQRGDIITFEGIYEMNPMTRRQRPLKEFVVVADVSGKAVVASPFLHPRIVERGTFTNTVDRRAPRRGRAFPSTVYGDRVALLRPELSVRVVG